MALEPVEVLPKAPFQTGFPLLARAKIKAVRRVQKLSIFKWLKTKFPLPERRSEQPLPEQG